MFYTLAVDVLPLNLYLDSAQNKYSTIRPDEDQLLLIPAPPLATPAFYI